MSRGPDGDQHSPERSSKDECPRQQPPPASRGLSVARACPPGSCAQLDAALGAPTPALPLRPGRPDCPSPEAPPCGRRLGNLLGQRRDARRGRWWASGWSASGARGSQRLRSDRRLVGLRGEERLNRRAAESGLGTWAPFCVAARGAGDGGRGGARGRAAPPPSFPQARSPPREPTSCQDGAGQSSRKAVSGRRGAGSVHRGHP